MTDQDLEQLLQVGHPGWLPCPFRAQPGMAFKLRALEGWLRLDPRKVKSGGVLGCSAPYTIPAHCTGLVDAADLFGSCIRFRRSITQHGRKRVHAVIGRISRDMFPITSSIASAATAAMTFTRKAHRRRNVERLGIEGLRFKVEILTRVCNIKNVLYICVHIYVYRLLILRLL